MPLEKLREACQKKVAELLEKPLAPADVKNISESIKVLEEIKVIQEMQLTLKNLLKETKNSEPFKMEKSNKKTVKT